LGEAGRSLLGFRGVGEESLDGIVGYKALKLGKKIVKIRPSPRGGKDRGKKRAFKENGQAQMRPAQGGNLSTRLYVLRNMPKINPKSKAFSPSRRVLRGARKLKNFEGPQTPRNLVKRAVFHAFQHII
jgi:hypothetical protein